MSNDQRKTLENLYNTGILSKEDFEAAIAKLDEEQTEEVLGGIFAKATKVISHTNPPIQAQQTVSSVNSDELAASTYIKGHQTSPPNDAYASSSDQSTIPPQQHKSMSTPPQSFNQEPVSRVGSYYLYNSLGKGGMGEVYRARHINDTMAKRQGGDVAIKLMHPQYTKEASFRERFDREASVGLKLKHKGIVEVFDLVQEGEILGLVMELIQGTNLDEKIGDEVGPIPWEKGRGYFEQILDAMEHAHDQGVVHRDLKPENIMVCDNGEIRVLDFGIAKDLSSSKTKTGMGMGTIHYMAPEQFLNAKDIDARADIYALGVTLYEMVAGQLPWPKGESEYNIMKTKDQGDFPSPSKYYPYIPPFVLRAIDKSTKKEQDERFSNIAEFREALFSTAAISDTSVPEASPIVVPPPSPSSPPTSSSTMILPPDSVASTPTTSPPSGASQASSGLFFKMLLGIAALMAIMVSIIVLYDDTEPEVRVVTKTEVVTKTKTITVQPRNVKKVSIPWINIEADTNFSVGTSNGDKRERPVHSVYVESFEMMKSEVTVEAYRKCVSEGPCTYPDTSESPYCNYNDGYSRAAVNCVSWSQARTFCSWLDARLPTEAEWEYAGNGGTGSKFPWGNSPDWSCSKTVSAKGRASNVGIKKRSSRACGNDRVMEVCSKTSGNTSDGLCDMSGNLWEWVANCDTKYNRPKSGGRSCPYDKVTRGGGFWSNAEQIRITRRTLTKSDGQMDVGFRCVR